MRGIRGRQQYTWGTPKTPARSTRKISLGSLTKIIVKLRNQPKPGLVLQITLFEILLNLHAINLLWFFETLLTGYLFLLKPCIFFAKKISTDIGLKLYFLFLINVRGLATCITHINQVTATGWNPSQLFVEIPMTE